MRIVWARRVSQAVFLTLFLWFCAVSTAGDRWYRLGGGEGQGALGWPVNWFLEIDPLTALATLLTTGTVWAGLWWAFVTVVLTLLFGRLFCGFVCPFGTIHQAVGFLASGLRRRTQPVRYHPAQSVKYYLLILILAAAAVDLFVKVSRWSQEVTFGWVFVSVVVLGIGLWLAVGRFGTRGAVAAVIAAFFAWLLAGRILPEDLVVTSSLLTGLLDPIPLLYRSFNLVLLPIADHSAGVLFGSPRYHHGAWLIGGLFVGFVFLNLASPRFFCRFLCPLGALLGVLSRFAPWRIVQREAKCTTCLRCEAACEGACEPSSRIRLAECVLCMNCIKDCPEGGFTYARLASAVGEERAPDWSRRGIVASLVGGFVSVPMLRLGGAHGPDWSAHLVRPPGALPEPDLLNRCIRCGQCMRVCPTAVLQPAGLEAGLEALWTPILNNRIGTSGCQPSCVMCGQVCPTGAIRPFTLDEKLGRGAFEDKGPIRMGTAYVDRSRCLPWAKDRPCLVCQENCPASPKAIFYREVFRTVRGGERVVQRIEGNVVFLQEDAPIGHYRDVYLSFEWRGTKVRRAVMHADGGERLVLEEQPEAPLPEPGTSVRIEKRLQRPFVDPRYCTGCGICEHVCPVSGLRAIRVTAENESRSRDRAFWLH